MSVRGGLALVLCLMLAACGSSAPIGSASSSPPTAVVATSMPKPSMTALPLVSASPVATRAPALAPSPTLSPAERALVVGVRHDLIDCVPRRVDLPPRATAGVECRPDSKLVARVGVYGFSSDRDAALTYLERMQTAGSLRKRRSMRERPARRYVVGPG